MAEIVSQYIALIGAGTGVVISILTFYFTNRNMKKKMDIDSVDSTVKNSKEIQDMYGKAFDEFEARWTKRLEDQEKECEEKINGARRSIEEAARQKQGELLVKIASLEERNQDLKIQVANLGGIVQGATGIKIHQWTVKEQPS